MKDKCPHQQHNDLRAQHDSHELPTCEAHQVAPRSHPTLSSDALAGPLPRTCQITDHMFLTSTCIFSFFSRKFSNNQDWKPTRKSSASTRHELVQQFLEFVLGLSRLTSAHARGAVKEPWEMATHYNFHLGKHFCPTFCLASFLHKKVLLETWCPK